MKNSLKFLGALALLFTVAAPQVPAQTQRRLVLNTTFNFTIENREIPAGSYWITLKDGWMQLQTADGKAVTSVLTLPTEGKSDGAKARAIFHRYHNRYFLSQVWLASSARGRQTLESHDEQRARKHETPLAVVVDLKTQADGR